MPDIGLGLALVLVLILGAEFVNGWTDAPNAIATVVSTRSLSPYQAVVMAAVLNLLGVFSGTAVAATIGKGIIDPGVVDLTTVGGAMVGIILWSSLAARWGIPTSETHALVAGLAGAGLATAGPEVLLWSGWKKVLLGLLFSTFLGLLGGSAGCSGDFRSSPPPSWPSATARTTARSSWAPLPWPWSSEALCPPSRSSGGSSCSAPA